MQCLHLLARILWSGVEATWPLVGFGVGRCHIGDAIRQSAAYRYVVMASVSWPMQAVAQVGHDRADAFDEAYRIGRCVPPTVVEARM